MSDDLANNWGKTFVLIDQSMYKRKYNTAFSEDDYQTGEALKHSIVDVTQGRFSFEKLTPNGSDANLYAITSLCQGNNSTVLVACGSYVAGDQGPLQSWTTTTFQINDGPSFVAHPESEDISKFSKQHTIPLPYHIPGTISPDTLAIYEDECLRVLHARCIYQTCICEPITTLFLELMLASNGSVLSDRALSIIAAISKRHGFYIIVDEILTGGRCQSMLLTITKPKQFTSRVAYITMGKWFQCGMVLCGSSYRSVLSEQRALMGVRGASTTIDVTEPYRYFKEVVLRLSQINSRRQKVLQKILPNNASGDDWGEGLVIFVPRRLQGIRQGTKNRLLPLLNNTPIDFIRTNSEPTWNKEIVNKKTMSDILNWTTCSPFIKQDDIEDDRQALYTVILFLIDAASIHDWKSSKFFHTEVINQPNFNMRRTTNVLCLLKTKGFLCKTQKLSTRVQAWALLPDNLRMPTNEN